MNHLSSFLVQTLFFGGLTSRFSPISPMFFWVFDGVHHPPGPLPAALPPRPPRRAAEQRPRGWRRGLGGSPGAGDGGGAGGLPVGNATGAAVEAAGGAGGWRSATQSPRGYPITRRVGLEMFRVCKEKKIYLDYATNLSVAKREFFMSKPTKMGV